MTGKKLICAALNFFVLCGSASAQWVVSDPTSYMYYVEQIKQQTESVSQAMKQVETMGGVLTEAKSIKSQLEGHYNRAQALMNRMKRVQAAFDADGGDGIFSNAKKWGNVGRALDGVTGGSGLGNFDNLLGEELFKDTRKLLDEVFSDPRNTSAADQYRAADRKYQIKQDALKGVVARGEEMLGDTRNRLKTIDELAGMIDQTANMKDAQDLTNRILVEVLASLNSLLQITASAYQADALLKYSGSTDAAMNKRQERLKTLSNPSGNGLDELAKKLGASTNNRYNVQ